MAKYLVTKDAFENYKVEIKNLKEQAISEGKVNTGYHEDGCYVEDASFMNQIAILNERYRNLMEIVTNCELVENQDFYKNFDGKTVIIGSFVKFEEDGEEEIIKIVGYNEGKVLDEEIPKVSYTARLASSLVNAKVGDVVYGRKILAAALTLEELNKTEEKNNSR